MLLSKFSLLVSSLLLSTTVFASFTQKECLDVTYQLVVSHKNKLTFGMAKNNLTISKSKCIITVEHEKLKFLKNRWQIDVCREPVHIKYGVKGIEVLKKQGSCPNKNSADFCEAVDKIQAVIQDDGLIFAFGEKEDLKTDHGKVYCAYQLLGGYLNDNRIYSRYAPSKPAASLTPAFEPKSEATESTPSVDPVPPEDKSSSEGTF